MPSLFLSISPANVSKPPIQVPNLQAEARLVAEEVLKATTNGSANPEHILDTSGTTTPTPPRTIGSRQNSTEGKSTWPVLSLPSSISLTSNLNGESSHRRKSSLSSTFTALDNDYKPESSDTRIDAPDQHSNESISPKSSLGHNLSSI